MTTEKIGYDRQGDVVVITIHNAPVNALGHAVRSGLWQAVERFRGDAAAKIAVLAGEGKLFAGGADISEFGKPPEAPLLPDLIHHIEMLEKPVVAAMHGAALGGGLELALGCHYRLAMPGTRLALPEVTLGLLPGAGGTQRVPRLVGLARTLEMIISGAPVNEADALRDGLIDQIGVGDAREAGVAYARALLAAGAPPRRICEMPGPGPNADLFDSTRSGLKETARGLAAPFAIVDAIEASTRLPFREGIGEERRLFLQLMQTPQRAGLVHSFFLQRKVSQLPELAGIDLRDVAKIGIIGGGTMGAGIATAFLLAGYGVILVERDAVAAQKARATIDGNLAAAVKRGKLSEDERGRLVADGLACACEYEAVSDVDLVIEAVFEQMDLKKDVFRHLDGVVRPGAILATNTSYLDVNEIASATGRPGDVIGLHFFSPAHVMKLLEIVVADATRPDVMATTFAVAKTLGKVGVRAGVCDGFIGNRILARCRGAADRLVMGGASPYEVDRGMVDFGFAMGPFAVTDLAGLDIGYMTRERKAAYRDPRDVVPVWADELYHLGRFGQKSGRGYYVYSRPDRPGEPDVEVEAIIARYRSKVGVMPRTFASSEIQRRYMVAMVDEAARILDEGIAKRPIDVDAVLLFGYGFPRHRGGPMHWADSQGLPGLLTDMREWQKTDPYFWTPAPLLERLVESGHTFSDLDKA